MLFSEKNDINVMSSSRGEELLTKPIVILVGGRFTAGKDEFADYLVREHGFVKQGMSDTLANALERLDPLIGSKVQVENGTGKLVNLTEVRYTELLDTQGYVGAKTDPEVRRLLQVLGTEVGRELLGKNIWVDAAANRIKEQLAAGNERVVLTGARFPNELAIAQSNFNIKNSPTITSVWVTRPGLPADLHASETSVSQSDFEYVLDNSGDLNALYTASGALLDMILKDHE